MRLDVQVQETKHNWIYRLREAIGYSLLGAGLPIIFIGVILSAETGPIAHGEVDWFLAASGAGLVSSMIGVIIVPGDAW
jgi:hypothetical protein